MEEVTTKRGKLLRRADNFLYFDLEAGYLNVFHL